MQFDKTGADPSIKLNCTQSNFQASVAPLPRSLTGRSMKFRTASLALALTLVTSIAIAEAPPAPTRIRGVVTQIDDARVVVQPKTGAPVAIALPQGWRVSVTKPVKVDQIIPGSFIGTTEIPQADGSGRSLEVHVFPPGVKLGAGHYAWDSQPGSMMTNGTVGKVVSTP